jgi:hypothetical protein
LGIERPPPPPHTVPSEEFSPTFKNMKMPRRWWHRFTDPCCHSRLQYVAYWDDDYDMWRTCRLCVRCGETPLDVEGF